jgi:hypothetical protein
VEQSLDEFVILGEKQDIREQRAYSFTGVNGLDSILGTLCQ